MIYSIESAEAEIRSALCEFKNFSFGEEGIKAVFCKGAENSVVLEGDTLTVLYTTAARAVYSLFLYDSSAYTGKTENSYENLAAMLDVSRNAVRTVSFIKKFMRYLVLMGYSAIWLYMEDVYEIPEEPYFGYKRGRYSKEELKEIAQYGRKIGLEVIPAIQTLAHLNGIARWRRYDRIIDFADILLADEEETYQLIGNMFRSLQECFGCEKINIGMDEAHMVGLGKYLDKHGYTDRPSIIVRHLKRVCELASQYGFTKPMMWNDMFIRLANAGDFEGGKVPEKIVGLMPENITLCAWNYVRLDTEFYVEQLKKQKCFGKPVYFAGGANCWNGFTPQNKFGIRQTKCAMEGCKIAGVKNFVMTLWGDDGAECSALASLPVLAYCGGVANGRKDYRSLFKKLTGIDFEKFLRLDGPNEISDMNDRLVQPSKYMVYNDCLQGIFDGTVNLSDGDKYKTIASGLSRLAKSKEFGYIYATQAELARFLSVKYGIGVKTRAAYLSGDREKIRQLIGHDYKLLLKYLDRFYKAFRDQWFAENKSYGFEVQDYRLGGLKQRILHCRLILQEYADGKREKIEELEENVLSAICAPDSDGKSIWFPNEFKKMFTANVV